jgi:hypothetical protein
MADRCPSCGAAVFWLEHERTGERAPIDADSSPEGNIEVDLPSGTYRVLSGFDRDEAVAGGEQLRSNHFQTCPDRGKQRPSTGRSGADHLEMGLGGGPGGCNPPA